MTMPRCSTGSPSWMASLTMGAPFVVSRASRQARPGLLRWRGRPGSVLRTAPTYRGRGSMVARAVAGVVAALVLAPAAYAATEAPAASRAHVVPMHWFDWHAATRVQGRFGSTAVVGLTSNASLRVLRERYAFEQVHA